MKNLFFIAIFFFSIITKAEVLFDGYYKVTSYDKHIGFFISKYEFDQTKKQFKHTYYLRIAKAGMDLTESMKAISDLDFKPISYEYTQLEGKNAKLIDTKFKAGRMTGSITAGGKKTKINAALPEGAFLSSSLYYVMLKSPSGLKPGISFSFKAVAEELGEVKTGKSTILDKKMVLGQAAAYKVKNEFANSSYENFITDKGEVISAQNPTGISTELVANIAEATEGVSVNNTVLSKLFGEVPKGASNKLVDGSTHNPLKTPEEAAPAKTVPSESTRGVIMKNTNQQPNQKPKENE